MGDLEVYVICDLSQALTSDFEPGTFNFKFMQDENTFGTWQTFTTWVPKHKKIPSSDPLYPVLGTTF